MALKERGRASALECSWRMERQDGSQILVGRSLDASELKEGSLQGWMYGRIVHQYWGMLSWNFGKLN